MAPAKKPETASKRVASIYDHSSMKEVRVFKIPKRKVKSSIGGSGSTKDVDHPDISQRPRKLIKVTSHTGFSKEYRSQSRPPKQNDCCLSLLRRVYDGMQLHIPVRKRTPRVLVLASEGNDSATNHIPLIKRAQKSEVSEQVYHQAERQSHWKVFTDDESLVCDALRALASTPLALPASIAEPVDLPRGSADGGESTYSRSLSDATLPNDNSSARSRKKKQKTSKVRSVEKQSEFPSRRPIEEKALYGEGVKPAIMFSKHDEAHGVIKKLTGTSVLTSVIEQEKAAVGDVDFGRHDPKTDRAVLPTKKKSGRKREGLTIATGLRDGPSRSMNLLNKHSPLPPGTAPYLKDKLSCLLSSPLVRRWCGFEWFYSTIDYPWFAKNEFVEYLNHVGLGLTAELSRAEWGVIKSSLGKPRRFCENFLNEERDKLEQYRDSVRTCYSELLAGHRDGLPADLARPLAVGQRVIALHPKTREFHDGSVLTVDYNKCRVQFDHPELGVEFAKDINCMPHHRLDNVPEVMRNMKTTVNHESSEKQATNGQSMGHSGNMETRNSWAGASALSHATINETMVDVMSISSHSKERASGLSRTLSPMLVNASNFLVRPRERDNQRVVHLNDSLERKVLPLIEGKSSRIAANDAVAGRVPHSLGDSEDSASRIAEAVRSSRETASKMVDAAIQAVSFSKDGVDACARIGEALDSIYQNRRNSMSGLQPVSSSSPKHGRLNEHNQLSFSSNNSRDCVSGVKDLGFPAELITSCVSTLLTIQTCAGRQCPPTEVAQILDDVVKSMRPCCPQNLSVHRDIEMCMGRIKTQIMALIPS